ncbi:MAG TPA: class I lanthipeptide [Chitinophaga sp.]|uniref:class I lanthipeptide n=1 Tax=Chitinophaga sp. TaxID=1869181 RepID=UPI002CC73E66|nr:class I lanthipeptide [Chitinophaga sp.]HVI43538.1 class I lanthipeptide [Chitinophaga sp.]
MKKKVSIGKKLVLIKSRIADLNKGQQAALAGGQVITLEFCSDSFQGCPTWDPEVTCESNPIPGRVCV